jgi:hypothetical protein
MNHIRIEEIKSLSEIESNMLLYICNVWAPIVFCAPDPENPHPVTLNLIRYCKREAIIDRINQAENVIKDEGKEIYNGLRVKLGMPLIEFKPIDSSAVKPEEPIVVDETKTVESVITEEPKKE